MSVSDLADHVNGLPGRLVITGGEPLIQRPALEQLIPLLDHLGVDLETNGTRPLGRLERLVSTISCSPKVGPSAGQDSTVAKVHPDVLASRKVDFKFVVRDEADLDAVIDWTDQHAVHTSRIWLMPEGTTVAELDERTPFVMNAAADHHFNFSTRMHVYGWGTERGH